MDCFWSCLVGGGAWQLHKSCKLKEQLTVICATVSKKRDRSDTANGIGCVTAVGFCDAIAGRRQRRSARYVT